MILPHSGLVVRASDSVQKVESGIILCMDLISLSLGISIIWVSTQLFAGIVSYIAMLF